MDRHSDHFLHRRDSGHGLTRGIIGARRQAATATVQPEQRHGFRASQSACSASAVRRAISAMSGGTLAIDRSR